MQFTTKSYVYMADEINTYVIVGFAEGYSVLNEISVLKISASICVKFVANKIIHIVRVDSSVAAN